MKKSILFLCLLIAVGGCYGKDKSYSIASEQYAMGWILHNIDNQTNTTLDYSFDDLAVYNYSFNYPAQQPQEYSNIFFWIAPIPTGGSGGAAAQWIKLSAPMDRVYYVMGTNPVPENYRTNWSFSNYMYINYLTSNNTQLQFAYEVAHKEHYESESAFYALKPSPGDRVHVYFGTAPFTPPSVFVSNNYLKLSDHLMRGYGGNSYLLRRTKVTVTGGTGETVTSYTALPTYQIYLNNSLIKEGNLTANNKWNYTKLNYYLSSDGLYLLNLTIPSNYPVWNITRILAYFRKPSSDLNPPTLNHLEASPRFSVNEPLTIEVNASDASNISGVKVYFNTGGETDDWSELEVGFNNLVYNTSLTLTNDSINYVNLKVNLTDTLNNSITYIILPVSLKERDFSLNFTSNENSTNKGDTIWVGGECGDEFNLNCSGLRLEYYLDDLLLGVDMTNWSGAAASRFGSELQIPYNFTSTKANISVYFKGTGVYPTRIESISLDVVSYEHNLAVGSLTLGTFRLNERGDINATVYNIGLFDEADVDVRLFINGNLSGSIHFPILDVGSLATLHFNWTPTEAGNHSINVSVEPVSGETHLADNSLEGSIIVGADVTGETILNWSEKFLLNESMSTRIRVRNVGNETATNPTINLYDIHSYKRGYMTYNETDYITFENTTYNITTVKLDDSTARFNISYNDVSAEHTLFREQFVELGNGVLFELTHLGSGDAYIYLENASSVLTKNLSDIQADEIVDEEVNWTPTLVGSHRLKLLVNASNDANPRNNYDSSSVNVRLDMADAYADISWQWGRKAIINETSNVTLRIYNYGARTATNLSLMFNDMFDYEYNYLHYDEQEEVCYNNTCYNITATNAGDDRITLNISSGENSSQFILYDDQSVLLSDDVLLYVYSISSTYAWINLGKTESLLKNISDIGVDEYIEEIATFTPSSLGNHILTLGVTAPEDADWTDNFYSRNIQVVVDAPDVYGYIYSPSLMANSTANVTVRIYNKGVRNASNTTFRLFQKHENETNYTLLNETFMGEMEVNGREDFVLNWTPTRIGSHTLRLEVNCSGDGDLINNVYTRSVSVSERQDPDAYEEDNTYLNAKPILMDGSPQRHTFYPWEDVDWVKFFGVDGAEYTIETFNLSTNTDTRLYLYDVDGTTLLRYNNNYIGRASRINWNYTQDGTYYVKVAEVGDDIGSYLISVNTSSPATTIFGVSLNYPRDSLVDYDGNVFFVYTPSSATSIPNCTLYTNQTGSWAVSKSDNTIYNRRRNGFRLLDMPNGTYLWNVECIINAYYPMMAEENRSFTVNNTALQYYSPQLNVSLGEPVTIDYGPTNVSIRVETNESISNAYLSISRHNSSAKEANLGVPGLNKYITIEADSLLENSITSIFLEISYTEEELNASGLNETDLAMWWYSETLSRWQILNASTMDWVYGTGVNTTANLVWANVTHFSEYTIAEDVMTQSISLTFEWNLISIPLVV